MVKHHPFLIMLCIAALMVLLAGCGGSPTSVPTPITFSSAPGPTGTALDNGGQYQPTISVPADLHLTGQLIFSDYALGVVRLDFATSQITRIYQPPENGSVNAAALSPDGKKLLITYSPPPDPNNPHYSSSSVLYTLPADGSAQPTSLLGDAGSNDYDFSPWWSPDGHYVYYGRYINPVVGGTPVSGPVGYFLTRYALPSGPLQDIRPNVLAARVSADGKKLFFVSVDPTSFLSNIYSADPDGGNAQNLLPGGDTWIVDSLAVSPDGQTVLYSSSSSTSFEPRLTWFEQLMGVEVAQAHNVPSDLWMVKVGQAAQQITHLGDMGFISDFSPDGQFIVFSCTSGVYVMRADGSGLTKIIDQPINGALQWVQ
jgi:Tol biopolymer transport system component